jgi:hypothetical protein
MKATLFFLIIILAALIAAAAIDYLIQTFKNDSNK